MAATQPAAFPHSLCTTQQSVDAAVNFLQSCKEIIVDWTGCDVGVQGGTLSTIVICKVRRGQARSIPTVYIFDILELGNAGCSLQPIFTLLHSPDVRKFVFDGRYGNSALRLYAGDTDSSVSIFNNVIDIQLAETNYRVRSPKDRRCLHFLKPAQRLGMTVNYVRRNAEIFRHIHILSSFGKCISHCRLGEDNHNALDPSTWLIRPLPQESISDIVNGAFLLNRLINHFRFITYDDRLQAISQRYISLWGNLPAKGDVYSQNPILPLEILQSPSGPRKQCGGCQRTLTRASFPPRNWTAQTSHRFCFVCVAINRWQAGEGKEGERRQRMRSTGGTSRRNRNRRDPSPERWNSSEFEEFKETYGFDLREIDSD